MDDEAEVRAAVSAYVQAVNTADAALAVSLFTDTAVLMAHQAPTAVGLDAIAATYRHYFGLMRIDVRNVIDDVRVQGDTASVVAHSSGSVTPLAGGNPTPERNRELFLLARTEEGWKIDRYMFNPAVPAPAG